MKARLINTKFWSDTFISELNPLDRYLFLYFLTNEHTNIAGIYELPLKTISFETGLEIDMLKKMLKRLTSKIMYIDGCVAMKNWEKHQSSSEDVKTGIKRELSNIPQKIREKVEKWDDGGSVGGGSRDGAGDLTKPNLTQPNEDEASSSEINDLIKLFEEINPSCKRMYGNKTQRKACSDLINNYTYEKVVKVIEKTLPAIRGLKFFPTITTPLQLNEKWSALENAIVRHQSEQKPKYI